MANTRGSNRKNVSTKIIFPWLLRIFIFHWPIFNIPWQFPDLEKISNFPDFSSLLATLSLGKESKKENTEKLIYSIKIITSNQCATNKVFNDSIDKNRKTLLTAIIKNFDIFTVEQKFDWHLWVVLHFFSTYWQTLGLKPIRQCLLLRAVCARVEIPLVTGQTVKYLG